MVLLGKENNWLNLLDSKTGLVGWSLDENFSKEKPDNILLKDYTVIHSKFSKKES